MIWQPPRLKLFTLSYNEPTIQLATGGPLNGFVATGTGFLQEETQLVFVRADVSDGSLKPYQVIPCIDLRVDEKDDVQRITFRASLFQRDVGPYHLVGWNAPPDDGVNDSAVLEWSMAVRLDPAQLRVKIETP